MRLPDQPIGRPIEELVPQDHVYRFLDATRDRSLAHEWVADCYAEGGRPSIDPVVGLDPATANVCPVKAAYIDRLSGRTALLGWYAPDYAAPKHCEGYLTRLT